MALSGTKTFSLNHLELIQEACRIARITDFDSVPDANMKAVATKFLNVLAARWANLGVMLWNIEVIGIPLVADQGGYTNLDQSYWGPAVYGHYFRNNTAQDTTTVDTEIEFVSWSEWNKIEGKYETGPQVEKLLWAPATTGNHTIYVSPIPSVSTGLIQVTMVRKTDDFVNESDDADFGANWYMALVYGVAVHMARISGAELDDVADLKADAQRYFDEAMHGKVHREHGDVRFIPGFYARGRDYYL